MANLGLLRRQVIVLVVGVAGLPWPMADRPVPFRPGEVLVYDVSWSGFVTAGTLTSSVAERRAPDGSSTYHIVAEGRPTPLLSKVYTLYYRAETTLDARTLLPEKGSTYSEEGHRRRLKVTEFDQGKNRARYEIRTATVVTRDLTVPTAVLDGLSAVYVLRSMSLKLGDRVTLPVCDSGKVYAVHLMVARRDSVRTPSGVVPALQVAVALTEGGRPLEGHGLELWLSDDARHLPLRFAAGLPVGSFVLTLRRAI